MTPKCQTCIPLLEHHVVHQQQYPPDTIPSTSSTFSAESSIDAILERHFEALDPRSRGFGQARLRPCYRNERRTMGIWRSGGKLSSQNRRFFCLSFSLLCPTLLAHGVYLIELNLRDYRLLATDLIGYLDGDIEFASVGMLVVARFAPFSVSLDDPYLSRFTLFRRKCMSETFTGSNEGYSQKRCNGV